MYMCLCIYVVHLICIIFNEMSGSRERAQQEKGSEDRHVCL